MSELMGNAASQDNEARYAHQDAWNKRWRELEHELEHKEYPATTEDLEQLRQKLLSPEVDEDGEVYDSGLSKLRMQVANTPEGLMSYYQIITRHQEIESMLAAEGLAPPPVE